MSIPLESGCCLNLVVHPTGQPLAALSVREAMSKTLHAAKPGDSVAAAEELMRAKQVRRLPVVDDLGRLLGIVTLNDLARAARDGGPRRSDAVTPGEVAITLASIGEIRSGNSIGTGR